jgi:hypothetical protein
MNEHLAWLQSSQHRNLAALVPAGFVHIVELINLLIGNPQEVDLTSP